MRKGAKAYARHVQLVIDGCSNDGDERALRTLSGVLVGDRGKEQRVEIRIDKSGWQIVGGEVVIPRAPAGIEEGAHGARDI